VPLNTSSSTAAAFGTNEAGAKMQMPSGCGFWCDSISFFALKVGTPTGNMRFKLYVYAPDGTTLLSTNTTNATISAADMTTSSQWCKLPLMPPVFIPAGAVVRAVISETAQADTSANAYKYAFTGGDSDANSLAMYPLLMKTTNTTDGTVGTPHLHGCEW
jgi:hypothetical protein